MWSPTTRWSSRPAVLDPAAGTLLLPLPRPPWFNEALKRAATLDMDVQTCPDRAPYRQCTQAMKWKWSTGLLHQLVGHSIEVSLTLQMQRFLQVQPGCLFNRLDFSCSGLATFFSNSMMSVFETVMRGTTGHFACFLNKYGVEAYTILDEQREQTYQTVFSYTED